MIMIYFVQVKTINTPRFHTCKLFKKVVIVVLKGLTYCGYSV